jgi:hypothetical protein
VAGADHRLNTGVPAPEEHRWRRWGAGLLWVLLCSTLGAMLMVLPWLWVWEHNYFAGPASRWSDWWLNPYLRGAITGLGVVNVGISFCELLRLWRWWPPWRAGKS